MNAFRELVRPPDRWVPGILLALFILSFVLRAGYLVWITGPSTPLTDDSRDYLEIAASFVRSDGWGLPDGGDISYRPPLVSFQLWAVYLFAGESAPAARWTMVFFSSLVAPALFLLARALLRGAGGPAVLAAALWAAYLPSIRYASVPLTETTAALLTVAGLAAFLRASGNGGRWPVVLAGALWALSALNRPVYLVLPLAILAAQMVLSLFGPIHWGLRWRRWALVATVFVIVMAPWTIRNYLEHGVFMPATSGGGYILLIAKGDLSAPAVRAGGWHEDPEQMARRAEGRSEVERDAISRRLALDEVRENWRLLPGPVLRRAVNYWVPIRQYPPWTHPRIVLQLIWIGVLALFMISTFARSWRQHWPALVVILYAFVTTLPFWGTPRFRFPVDSLLITGAAVGLWEVAERLRTSFQQGVRP